MFADLSVDIVEYGVGVADSFLDGCIRVVVECGFNTRDNGLSYVFDGGEDSNAEPVVGALSDDVRSDWWLWVILECGFEACERLYSVAQGDCNSTPSQTRNPRKPNTRAIVRGRFYLRSQRPSRPRIFKSVLSTKLVWRSGLVRESS